MKKYTVYFLMIFMIGLLVYDYHFRKMYTERCETEGLYAVGEIQEITSYGRATGYNFVYTFPAGNKIYTSKTDIKPLDFHKAKTLNGKTFSLFI